MGKPKPNAFAFYMQERRKQFEKEGKKYTMSQMPELVHKDWKSLSADQKKKYEDMCKNVKGASRLASDGTPLSLVEMNRIQQIDKDKAMKKDIELYLNRLMQSEQIIKEYFYIININEYCYYASKDEYIAAEIGICCFNLSKGVINDYHVILDPEELPLGYKGTATKFSEETHRLPIPPNAIGETNYELVLNDIISFLSTDPSKGNEISVMFALGDENRNDNKNYTKVTSVMADLATKHGLMENKFKIYPLTYLFFYFNKLIGETTSYPSTSLVLNEIEKDIYAYENAIACEPHKKNEAINWCARSKSIRYAYSFLEHFCPHYGIQLKPGCHVPENAKIKSSDIDSETMSHRSFNTRSQSIKSEVASEATYSFADDDDDNEDDTSAIPSTYASDVDSDY